jgi:endonuclease YncB( thermonuclease family)
MLRSAASTSGAVGIESREVTRALITKVELRIENSGSMVRTDRQKRFAARCFLRLTSKTVRPFA